MNDRTKELPNVIANVLLRCWVFGFLLLFLWLGVTQLFPEFTHNLHGPMFGLTSHELDVIFYCGMGLLKLVVLTLFLIPWMSIKLVLRGQDSQ